MNLEDKHWRHQLVEKNLFDLFVEPHIELCKQNKMNREHETGIPRQALLVISLHLVVSYEIKPNSFLTWLR